jgi:DNA mismatch endonuclease (patch repair protein)
MDVLTKEQRRRNMQAIRKERTTPERVLEAELRRRRFRVTCNLKDLPGRPDLVLPARKVAVFVHGCFWHRHARCRFAASPATNREFWAAKFEANRKRDQRKSAELRALGWRVVVVWECEIRRQSFPEIVSRIRSA